LSFNCLIFQKSYNWFYLEKVGDSKHNLGGHLRKDKGMGSGSREIGSVYDRAF
jgi:hypothetical protein